MRERGRAVAGEIQQPPTVEGRNGELDEPADAALQFHGIRGQHPDPQSSEDRPLDRLVAAQFHANPGDHPRRGQGSLAGGPGGTAWFACDQSCGQHRIQRHRGLYDQRVAGCHKQHDLVLAFFDNTFCWQMRFGTGTGGAANRVMVCFKEAALRGLTPVILKVGDKVRAVWNC